VVQVLFNFLSAGTLTQEQNARDGIRTQELLRDQALNLAPLTWLGYPRACIDYVPGLIKVRGNYKGELMPSSRCWSRSGTFSFRVHAVRFSGSYRQCSWAASPQTQWHAGTCTVR